MKQESKAGCRVRAQTSRPGRLLLVLSASLLISCGQDEASSGAVTIGAGEWIDSEYRSNQEKYAADPGMLIERGLLANRKHRYIDLLATATGVGPDNALDAFIVAGNAEPSRSIAVTTVQPDTLQAALEFIGMTAGHPMDGASTHHWPKGERVTVTFYWRESEAGQFTQSVRAEHLITDRNWNRLLPALGFRFVGPTAEGAKELATVFNATNTILEVPYIVDRNLVQGRLVASEDYRFAIGQKLRIRIRPEFRDSRKRVHDFVLEIQAGVGPEAEQLQNLRITLSTPEGDLRLDGDFESTFVYLKALLADGKEPFLQLNFSDSLGAGSVRTIARFVRSFLIAQDIRIEPSEAHLFYSAFLPREEWRDPGKRGRASQPVEIHLETASAAGGLIGELVQYPLQPDVTAAIRKFEFSSEKELAEAIQNGQPWGTDGVFLFVRPDSPYVDIRQVHNLVRSQFPNLYVFL